MHINAWILLIAVYALFSVWTTMHFARINGWLRAPWWTDKFSILISVDRFPRWPFRRRRIRPLKFVAFYPLSLLRLALMWALSPIGHLGWLFCFVKDKREARRQIIAHGQQQERVRKYREEHLPVIYYCHEQGVTEVMSQESYDKAARERDKNVRNGTAVRGSLLPPVMDSYLYVHASAKNVPDGFKSGLLSDFDELKKLAEEGRCKVERRRDIFVHFVSEGFMSFSEQEKTIANRNIGFPIEHRAGQAQARLLRIQIPQEVLNPIKQ